MTIGRQTSAYLKHFSLPPHTRRCKFALSPIVKMAKRLTDNIITGNDPNLRMYFYYSPHFGQNIWRRGTSLTGERTKKDPAFKGFRQSSSRLKIASPIAALLYKMLPEQLKQYSLYRTLTGEAIKMLKEGMDAAVITETLKTKYINQLLDSPNKKSENRRVEEPATREHIRDMRDFTSYPQIPSRVRKITRTTRSYLLQKITEGQSVAEHFPSYYSDPQLQTSRHVSESPSIELKQPKPRSKTTHGLIYLGRLPECKKLKMWLKPFAEIGILTETKT